jgi:hypothetical protein
MIIYVTSPSGTTPIIIADPPPYLDNLDPAPLATVGPYADIKLEVKDDESGVAQGSVDITLNGTLVWQADAEAAPLVCSVVKSDVVDGYRYVLNPMGVLPLNTNTVAVYATDRLPPYNVLDSYYQFQVEDSSPPFLVALDPAEGSIGNPSDGYISLAVVDAESKVDGGSIIVTVDGITAYDGTFHSPYDGSGSSFTGGTYDGYDGYLVVLDRTSDFPSYHLVTVEVLAEDLYSNVLDHTYYFRIEDYEPPFLRNLDPAAGYAQAPVGTDIELEIADAGVGVNADSVVLSVDSQLAWSARTAQAGFSVSETPLADGYRYVIDPDAVFPDFHWVTVDAYALDLDTVLPNVLDAYYQFRTGDSNPPFLIGLDPDEGTSGNPADGYVSLDIVDREGSTIGTSIVVTVDGGTAYDGAFHFPYDGSGSSFTSGTYDGYDGYRIVLDRISDFASYQLVEVRAIAEDALGNELDRTYAFRIEDYVGPVLANEFPANGSDEAAPSTLVSFDMYDPGSGIDLSTLRIVIDGMDAYDGYGFVSPFDGYVTGPVLIDGYDGYHVDIQIDGYYQSARHIVVEIDVSDREGN